MNPNIGEKKKEYTEEHIGVVVSLDDPEKMMRVQVKVRDLFDGVPDSDLPWATYKLPVGVRPNDGYFIPVDVGDTVWVDFPFKGDTRYPRITGGVHWCPGQKPNMPHEAWVGEDCHVQKRRSWESERAEYVYHKDMIWTQHGITIQMRDDKSYSVIQRDTGTELYIHPDGKVTLHVRNKLSISSTGDMRIHSDTHMVLTAPRIDLNPNGWSGE